MLLLAHSAIPSLRGRGGGVGYGQRAWVVREIFDLFNIDLHHILMSSKVNIIFA